MAEASDPETERPSLHIVIIGTCEKEKNKTANYILERKEFEPNQKLSEVLTKYNDQSSGKIFKVSNTPNIITNSNNITFEDGEVIDAFLLVFETKAAFEQRDLKPINMLKQKFGGETFSKNTILVLKEDSDIPEWIDKNRSIILGKDSPIEDIITKVEAVKNEGVYVYHKSESDFPVLRPGPSRCMVLVGKTGVGKSSLGNTLLSKDRLESEHMLRSNTMQCQKGTEIIDNRKIQVIDTPGLDATRDCLQLLDPLSEVAKSIYHSSDGVDAILVVVNPIQKMTKETKHCIQLIRDIFGKDELNKNGIVVFTHEDQLLKAMDNDSEKIPNYLVENNDIEDLLEDCCSRHIFVDNTSSKVNRKLAAKIIIGMIDYQIAKEENSHKLTQESFTNIKRRIPAPDLKCGHEEKDSHIPIKVHERRRCFLLVGKTGHGKSSLGNTILSEESKFDDYFSIKSNTMQCQKGSSKIGGRKITVIDAPGTNATKESDQNISPHEELGNAIVHCEEGIDAILTVIDPTKTIGEEEKLTIEMLTKIFEEDIKKIGIVVFTHYDQLLEAAKTDDKKELLQTLTESEVIKETIDLCNGRYMFVNNLSNKAKKSQFRGELLEMVDSEIVREGAKHRCSPDDFRRIRKNIDMWNKERTKIDLPKLPPGPRSTGIALVGKSGNGKSSYGNTILCFPNKFENALKTTSNTMQCQKGTARIDDRLIRVVDTPGTDATEDCNQLLHPLEELGNAISHHPEGFDAIAVVINPVQTITAEVENSIILARKIFSDEELSKCGIVAFTHFDMLKKNIGDDMEDIRDFIDESPVLRNIVAACDDRFILVDNTANEREKKLYSIELIELIDSRIRKNDNSHKCTVNDFEQIKERIPRKKRQEVQTLPDPEGKTRQRRERRVSERPLKLLLVGKTGSGKSSTGNTLLGQEGKLDDYFTVKANNMQSVKGISKVFGREVLVVDTAGLSATAESGRAIDPLDQLGKAIVHSPEGFDAILIVHNAVSVIAEEEKKSVNLLIEVFGEEELKRNGIVIFTHMDHLIKKTGADNRDEHISILREDDTLNNLLETCNNRCCFVNNSAESVIRNQFSKEIMNIVDHQVIENNQKPHQRCSQETFKNIRGRIEGKQQRKQDKKQQEQIKEMKQKPVEQKPQVRERKPQPKKEKKAKKEEDKPKPEVKQEVENKGTSLTSCLLYTILAVIFLILAFTAMASLSKK